MEPKVIPHVHNDTDAPKISFVDLVIFPEEEIAVPTGGATIDSEARTAINQILALLQNKGLMK